MTAFDIRASDKGPGKARPPRTKQPRGGGGSSGGGGGSSWWPPCLVIVAMPFGLFALAMSLLAAGAVR